MRRYSFIFVLAIALAGGYALAQQTRRSITKASPGDAKPNSSSVPEVYAIPGQFQRILVLRFKNQADLLAGLEKMVKEQKIKNAVILAGVGSVRDYQVHSVSNRDFPSKNTFVKDPSAPADIVSVNGYIVNGEVAHQLSTGVLVIQSFSQPPDGEQDSVEKSLWPGWTARNINVHGQDLVDASKRRIVLAEDAATDAAGANRDDYLRFGHRSIRLQQRKLHVPGDWTGYQEHIGVTRRCDEMNAEPFDIIDRIVQGDDLQFASIA